jgi:lipopolysaccharide export system protein LptC
MARADAHTRVVTWLKIALPLAALAILSTLFLLADKIDPEDALPYAEVDVEDLAREPRMTLPSYAGTTSDGAALSLTAEAAMPGSADKPAEALKVRLELVTPDGATTQLHAASAVMDPGGRMIVLSGGVTLTTSHGYVLETKEIHANLDRSGLEAPSGVTATTPSGKLTSNSMTLSQDNQTPDTYLMVFKGDVRLVYLPGG